MAEPAQRGSRGRGRAATPSRTEPAGPDVAAHLVTGSTYRHLVVHGLAPAEAANLTAFMCGIPVADIHWSLNQVNQLLFLRELARTGRFGFSDGGRALAH